MAVGTTNITGGFVNYISGLTNFLYKAIIETSQVVVVPNINSLGGITLHRLTLKDGGGVITCRLTMSAGTNDVSGNVRVNGVSVFSFSNFSSATTFQTNVTFNKGDIIDVRLTNSGTVDRAVTITQLNFSTGTPVEQLNFTIT
jgi:hypothetical protein